MYWFLLCLPGCMDPVGAKAAYKPLRVVYWLCCCLVLLAASSSSGMQSRSPHDGDQVY